MSGACRHAHCDGCAEAASLRDRVDELRTELESHVNADAAWKIQVGDLRSRLAAAEAERDEIQGNLERATEAFLSWRERAERAEAERDELRGLVERAVAELAGVEAFSLERLIPHNSVTRLLHDLRAALPAAIPEGAAKPSCIHGHDPKGCEFGPCAAIPEGTPTK